MTVTNHRPEDGPLVGGFRREPVAPPRAVVVSVSIVVTVELPGITDGFENDAMVAGGRFVAVKVMGFGKPPVPGVTWMAAVMGCPATTAAGGVGTVTVKSIPVPESETVCVVLGDASSVIVSVAGPRAPTAAGVNVTLMSQLAAGATVEPFVQVVPVVAIAKSAAFVPLIATVVMCSVEPPGFVTVILDAPPTAYRSRLEAKTCQELIAKGERPFDRTRSGSGTP